MSDEKPKIESVEFPFMGEYEAEKLVAAINELVKMNKVIVGAKEGYHDFSAWKRGFFLVSDFPAKYLGESI